MQKREKEDEEKYWELNWEGNKMEWNGNFLNFQRKETRGMYETKSSAGQKLESASEGEKAALTQVHSPWTRLEKCCARNALSTCCRIERCPFSLVNECAQIHTKHKSVLQITNYL